MDYDQRLHIAREIHRIGIVSGDVAPEEVEQMLANGLNWEHSGGAADLFKSFAPLCTHVPGAYVSFALDYLLGRNHRDLTSSEAAWIIDSLQRPELGIGLHHTISNPTPLNGPYLFLLRHHEEHGLRLVRELVNTATSRWKWAARHGHALQEEKDRDRATARTPLPIVIDFPWGRTHFWGDEDIFRWFRTIYRAPQPVVTALMALEWWVEEQIEEGAPPTALFQRVIEGQRCSAVVGILLGVAMAHFREKPEDWEPILLPFLCQPQIWRCDVERYIHDGMNLDYLRTIGNPTLGTELHRHNARPQRNLDIRNFTVAFLYQSSPEARTQLAEAGKMFTRHLPLLWRDEAQDEAVLQELRERAETWSLSTDPDRVTVSKNEEGHTILTLEMPDHIRERNESLDRSMQGFFGESDLMNWARKALEGKLDAPAMTSLEALEQAQRILYDEDLPAEPPEDFAPANRRLRAIVSTIVAALVIDFEAVVASGHLEWCRNTLLRAAASPVRPEAWNKRESVGHGLGALVAHGESTDDVYTALLQLALTENNTGLEGLMLGVEQARHKEPILSLNLWNAALSACLPPWDSLPNISRRERTSTPEVLRLQWLESLERKHIEAFKQDEAPSVPIFDPSHVNLHWGRLEHVLRGLPLDALAHDKGRLLSIIDGLLGWTLHQNTPREGDGLGNHINPPFELNYFLMPWLAHLCGVLSDAEAEAHIFAPVRQVWKVAPDLTTQLFDGFLRNRLAREEPPDQLAIEQWRRLSLGLLEDYRANAGQSSAFMAELTLSLVFFCNPGGYLAVPHDWAHAPLFRDVIQDWIGTVAASQRQVRHFITFLDGPGRAFWPEPALEWLIVLLGPPEALPQVLTSSQDIALNLSELLNRLWANSEAQIRGNGISLKRFSQLIDALESHGNPLAGLLTKQLERVDD